MKNSILSDGRTVRAQEQRKVRRTEILKAAQKVIGQRGYQSTSIANVLDEASISRGTFYLYFTSRESLFHELVDGFIQQLKICITPITKEEENPIQSLYKNLQRVVDLLFDHRDLTTILLREAVGQDATIDQKLNEMYAFLYRMVSGALNSGADWGLTKKVDERVIAMAVIGSIKEVLYQYLVVSRETPPDRETIVQELLAFGLQGLQLTR